MGDERAAAAAAEREKAGGGERGAPDERLREMVELVEHVRHEMNNPLTGIIGQAQLLLRDETLGAPARRRVRAIEELAERLRDAVARLRVVQTARGPATAAAHAEPLQTRTADEPPRH